MSIKLLKRGKQLTDQKAEKLKTKFLTNENFDILIDYDCDVIDNYGNPYPYIYFL